LAIDYSVLPLSKGRTRKQIKGSKDRKERNRKAKVRARCVERDIGCRLSMLDACDGPDEWAHLEEKKRARTRGQAPEVRHTTAHSIIFCRGHHRRYDAGEITLRLGEHGADGPVVARANGLELVTYPRKAVCPM